LNNNIIKFYFYKIYFYFINIESDRNYLDTKFKIYITDKCIEGDVSKLISFIDNIYPIEYIDVRLIYNTVDWKGYYKDLSDKEKKRLDKIHMRITLKSDLNYPIIVTVNVDGKITSILDGLHRIKKAYMLKIGTIKTYVIPEIDLLSFFEGGIR